MDPSIIVSRRTILYSLPIKIFNTNNSKKTIYDNADTLLSKNSSLEFNITNDNHTYNSLYRITNSENKLITSENLTKWYDPITKDYIVKSNSISYIIDSDEF